MRSVLRFIDITGMVVIVLATAYALSAALLG